MKTDFWSYLAQLFLERKMFQTNVLEEIKTHIFCPIMFFRKSSRLWNKVEKYCTIGKATYDNMAHAPCMLDT